MNPPACMTPDELDRWTEANLRVRWSGKMYATSPCADCTLAFALVMRAVDSCNGIPGTGRGLPAAPVTERRRELNREAQRRYQERRRIAKTAGNLAAAVAQ